MEYPHEARVCCPGGRWGRRRTRTTECFAVLKAEDLYTALLRDKGGRVAPGSKGTATVCFKGKEHTTSWEVRANAVWRRGRVFYISPTCTQRRTRLYLPSRRRGFPAGRVGGLPTRLGLSRITNPDRTGVGSLLECSVSRSVTGR
jgi:hypothetical protein